jgi:hypothetical protein
LLKLNRWIEHKKKIVANLGSNKTKADNCYLGPILNTLFRKWFPLFEVPLLRTLIPKKLVSPTSQERQVV